MARRSWDGLDVALFHAKAGPTRAPARALRALHGAAVHTEAKDLDAIIWRAKTIADKAVAVLDEQVKERP